MAKNKSVGNLLHCVAVRYRITGSGFLDSTLLSVDETVTSDLAAIPLQSSTNKLPTLIANFKQQGFQLEFSVDQINEWFAIDKIVIFAKPSATGYPQ